MDNNRKKEGVSVKEIEEFAKKNKFEVFFCLMFVLASIFGLFGFFKSGWNIVAMSAGGILSVLFPMRVDIILRKMLSFLFKHDITMQLVLGIVSLVLTVCFPFAVFFLIGLFGGKAMYRQAMESTHHQQ